MPRISDRLFVNTMRVGLAALLSLSVSAAEAALWRVEDVAALSSSLETAESGDTIVMATGLFRTRLTIRTKDLTLRGEPGAVLDADGDGIALEIRASGVTVENLEIRNYGRNLKKRHSGVRVYKGADGVTLRDLHLSGPGFGIRADRVQGIRIEDCSVKGDASLHELDRGDGVFLKNVRRPTLRNNTVRNVRDGFYLEHVTDSVSEGNRFEHTVYAVHFMYCEGGLCADNSADHTRGAWTVMDSNRVTVRNCRTSDNRIFGILLNVADGCDVYNNDVARTYNPQGSAAANTEGKALFIYGPGSNRIHHNRFTTSDIGISVAMGGEGNVIWENAVVDNTVQVRYVGTKPLEWSHKGRGNYWSNYLGWDINNDGVGDRPYQPNDSLDRLFWIYPEARFLMDSPVVALLRWLSLQFEIDRGKGVTDSFPLMQAP